MRKFVFQSNSHGSDLSTFSETNYNHTILPFNKQFEDKSINEKY